MSAPQPDTLPRVSAELTALSTRLSALSADVDYMHRYLLNASVTASATSPTTARSTTAPPTTAPPTPALVTSPTGASPRAADRPVHAAPSPAPAVAPTITPAASHPRAQISTYPSGSRRYAGAILAAAGVAITLIGVVLLLVLAARAGLLLPPIRVAGGAVLAAALTAMALHFHRKGFHVGAAASVATSAVAAQLDVFALSYVYHWVNPIVSVVGMGILAAVAMRTACRWGSQYLALLAIASVTVLTPLVVNQIAEPTLIAAMLVMSAAAVAMTARTTWSGVHIARVVMGSVWLLPASLAVGSPSHTASTNVLLVSGCAASAVIGIVATVCAVRKRINATLAAATSVIGTAPAFVLAACDDSRYTAYLLLAVAVVLVEALRLWAVGPRTDGSVAVLPTPVRYTWVAAVIACLMAVIAMCFTSDLVLPMYATVALVVSVWGVRSMGARVLAAIVSTVAVVMYFVAMSPTTLLGDSDQLANLSSARVASVAIAGILLLTQVIAIPWLLRRNATPPQRSAISLREIAALAIVLGLYVVTATLVVIGVAVAGPSDGFVAGHTTATICWVIGAAVALTKPLRWASGQSRVFVNSVGMSISAAAVAKLLLFDLSALDGVFRIIAFVVAGVTLLIAGWRFTRSGNNDEPHDECPVSDNKLFAMPSE